VSSDFYQHFFSSRRYWLLVVVIAACPFFFVGGPDWVSDPFIRVLWDSGHIVFFALVLVVMQSFRALSRLRDWCWVTLGVLVIGLLIEWIQQFFGREESLTDVFHNLVGVWLGLFWRQSASRLVWGLRIAAVVLVLPSVWTLVHTGIVQWKITQQFPLLNDFETSMDLARARGVVSLSTEVHQRGLSSLKVELTNETYSSTGIDGLLGDWRGYRDLAMELYNPDVTALSLVVKVTDKQHDRGQGDYDDRFNLPILLQPGWNTIRIPMTQIEHAPKSRLLNLEEVSRIGVFSALMQPGSIFYWDNLRVE